MKYWFLVALVIWAATALAAVPPYDRRDTELLPDAHGKDTVVGLHDDANENPEDKDESALEAYSQDKHFDFDPDNTTSTSLDKRWDSDVNPVLMYIGGPKQHVGTLYGNRLRNKILKCLIFVGAPAHGNTKSKGPQSEWCTSGRDDNECETECYINNIVYNADVSNDKYASNSRLKVLVHWSELYESKWPGIRELAYTMVADIFTKVAEAEGHCYDTHFTGSRLTTMCNTVKNVLLVLPYAKGHPLAASLNVVLEFNGATTQGNLDCGKGLSLARRSFQDNYAMKLIKVMNWKDKGLPVLSRCQPQACFDVFNTGYFGQHLGRWQWPAQPILGHFDWKGPGCEDFDVLK